MICICPKCGKKFDNKTNKKFCSRHCANSRTFTNDTRKKISCALCEKYKDPDFRVSNVKARAIAISKVHTNRLNRNVRAKNGQLLDITQKELEDYRNTHKVCEICGKQERATHNRKDVSKLCCDHDHATSRFRGLLCSNCNRKLGWYEFYSDKINKYLTKRKPL